MSGKLRSARRVRLCLRRCLYTISHA